MTRSPSRTSSGSRRHRELEPAGHQLVPVDELVVVIPVSVAVALVGILAYVVKKKDRQRERIHRAHQPPTGGTRDTNGD